MHEHGIVVMDVVDRQSTWKYCIAARVDIIHKGTEAGDNRFHLSFGVTTASCRFGKGTTVVSLEPVVYTMRGLAACLALGAEGVWIGSRFAHDSSQCSAIVCQGYSSRATW